MPAMFATRWPRSIDASIHHTLQTLRSAPALNKHYQLGQATIPRQGGLKTLALSLAIAAAAHGIIESDAMAWTGDPAPPPPSQESK